MRQLKAAIIVNVARPAGNCGQSHPSRGLRPLQHSPVQLGGYLDVHRHVTRLCVDRFQVEIEHSLT